MIAVSFCNTKKNSGVYILNDDFSLRSKIPNSPNPTGMDKKGDVFFVAIKGTDIAKIDSNFQIQSIFRTGLRDIHSIRIIGNFLYLVSTGTDTIAKIRIENENLVQNSLRIVWSSNAGRDSLHVNSLEFFEDELIFSGFGSQENESWKTAKEGFISTTKETLTKELKHPHSLKEYNNSLYFLESKTSTVFKDQNPLFTLDGYLRGLDFIEENFVIGSSKSRNDLVKSSSCATLMKINKVGELLDLIEFEDYEEIYDILIWNT